MKLPRIIVLSSVVSLLGCKGEIKTFTVTWKNYDGEILEIDENVEKGTTPSYDGVTPTHPFDDTYIYTFSGWSPELSSVESDITYTATFTPSPIPGPFTVTWKNDDDTILEVDELVPYGTIPTYDGPTPTKTSTIPVVKDYIFIGWDKELAPITSDMTYVATFKEDKIAALAINFNASEDHKEFAFTNQNTMVDWGDDSELSEDSYHEYADNRDYTIRFYIDSLAQFRIDSGLAGVTSLYFADTVNKISRDGFKGLENLESVRLPDGLTDLSAYAFSNNKVNFYKEIDNVYYLGNEANDHLYCFGTTNEAEINIAEGCEVLTNNSFAGSTLTTSLTLPSSLKVIGDDALNNCDRLQNITIPENVTYIGKKAFENCYQLVNVNIPNKIEVINESAFENCQALQTIAIPNSVDEIKGSAFYSCTNLSSVDMSNVNHFITGGDEMFEGCAINLTIKVKQELLAQYKNDPNWKNLNIVAA